VLSQLLNVGGKAIIISPQRSTNQDSSLEFVKKIDNDIFKLKK
jgi:hypothetical protein